MAVQTDPRLVPGVVPRAAWSRDGAGKPGRLRLVALSLLRADTGRDDVRPAPPVPAVVHDPRWLCCEGSCSPGFQEFRDRLPALAAVGYSLSSTRGQQSAQCVHTLHYFVRMVEKAETRYQQWACTKCGHERTYGAEEP